MARNTTKEGRPISGEVISREEHSVPMAPQTRSGRTIAKIFSFLSIFPFRNRMHLRTVQTATEVLKAQSDLADAYIHNQRTKGRLYDIETTLMKDHLECQAECLETLNRLHVAQLKQETWEAEKKHTINDINLRNKYELTLKKLDYRKKELLLKKEIDQLSEPPQDATQPKAKKIPDPIREKIRRAIKLEKSASNGRDDIEKSGLPQKAKEMMQKVLRNAVEVEKEKDL